MKLLGVTGGIGMGKSATDRFLRDRNIPVIDTDLLARQLVERGQPALEKIRQAFGNEIIDSSGALRRGELARRVFADSAARTLLEGILHPLIRNAWFAEANRWRKENVAIGAIIIPLLFETNAEENFKATICVACTHSTQQTRLRERGWTPEHIAQRIDSQWPVEKKIARSNFVIWTEGDLKVHEAQLERIIGFLKS